MQLSLLVHKLYNTCFLYNTFVISKTLFYFIVQWNSLYVQPYFGLLSYFQFLAITNRITLHIPGADC